MKKRTVAVVFGGRSGEHEVSKLSAQNVIAGLKQAGFSVIPIFIDKNGCWHINGREVVLYSASGAGLHDKTSQKPIAVDIFFPVLHGTYGEDGAIQGLFEMAGVPYVGAGVLGSAIGMDKEAQKQLYLFHGIPTPYFAAIRAAEWSSRRNEVIRRVAQDIGYPCFVKPANLGSSVGVSKIKSGKELSQAIANALEYDTKVLVEKCVKGREIMCGVMGNEAPKVSLPGEVIPKREFYDYIAKYVADDTEYKVAIPLPKSLQSRMMRLTADVFRATFCEGYARVDFFLGADNGLSVVEINTIPGFTNHSMFPRLWEASGISLPGVVQELVNLGMNRWQKRRRLQTSYKEGKLIN